MNVGIIAEYNPFHNGHSHQIKEIKNKLNPEAIIVVMSGSFVQRGEPACINKFDRAAAAISNGADIVLELPTVYSSSAADVFAFGACDILNKTNIVDCLCFGCESDNLSVLEKAADLLFNESEEFKSTVKEYLKNGSSYPKARFNALSSFISEDISFLKESNAILGVEYLKALKKLNSSIKPFIIKRNGSSYNSTFINSSFASSTAIRASFDKNIEACLSCMPQDSYNLFSSIKSLPSINSFTSIFYYIMITKKLQYISEISDITEGLENRIYESLSLNSIEETIKSVKTKRYTYSKIQRAILHIILDITKENVKNHNNPYIRVLGFRSEKRNVLSQLVKESSVPVITNVKKAEKFLSKSAYKKLEKEFTATDIYYMTQNGEKNMDFKHPLVVL